MECMREAAERWLHNPMLINHRETDLWPVFVLLAAVTVCLVPPSLIRTGRGERLRLTAGDTTSQIIHLGVRC